MYLHRPRRFHHSLLLSTVLIGLASTLAAPSLHAEDEIRAGAMLQIPFFLGGSKPFFDPSAVRVGLTCQFANVDEDEIINEVRTAGAEVIKRKGATFYAIAMSVNKICDNILRDANNIMTVSTMMNGKYGINDVCLSLPAVIGANGIEKEVTPTLTDEEIEKLKASAAALRSVLDQLEF